MEKIIRFLSSLKLAVALLIALALISVIGTFIPQGQEPVYYLQRYGGNGYGYLKFFGLVDLYHSWLFRAVTTLIATSLTVCSVRRFKGIYRRTFHPDAEKTAEYIRGLKLSNELPAPERFEILEAALAERRYRIRRRGRFIYGSKGVLGPWGDMITHLSILVILLGALVGSLGFVGTVNIYEGDWSDNYYNWNQEAERPLGFSLYVEKFTLEHYPVKMSINVRERSSGRKVGTFKVWEGGSFELPFNHVRVVADSIDTKKGEALLKLYSDDKLFGIYDTGLPEGGPIAPPLYYYTFDLAASSEPVPKNIASTVKIIRDGRLIKRSIIEINNPLKFEGLVIYQTAYSQDDRGRFYSGFQVVRDPGVPLVWAGFLLLMAGLFLSFYWSYRQVWIYIDSDRITIGGTTSKGLPGFMREYGAVIGRFIQEVEP